MFLSKPPTKDSSTSTAEPPEPPNFLEKYPGRFSFMAKRMRCSMNHAVFWVTPSDREISQDETPFLELVISQTAGSHFSRPSGESSKMVPTLAENCRLAWADLHCHFFCFSSHETSFRPQVGQVTTPSGQRCNFMNSKQLPSSEKWMIASCSVFGCFIGFILG